jgi:hypothetical protein
MRRWLAPRRLAALAVAATLAVLIGLWLNRQHDQLEQLRRQQDAGCVVYADVGQLKLLTPQSSRLARRIVMDAQAAARISGCAQ